MAKPTKNKTKSTFAKATADEPPDSLVDYLGEDFSKAPSPSETLVKEGVDTPGGSTLLNDVVSTNPESGKTRKPYTKRKKEGEDDGEPIVDGEMMVDFIDFALPALIALAHNSFNKENKISPDELDLTEKQKAKMLKFANKCAERLNMNVNPFLGLGFLMVSGYGMKYFQAKNK